MIHSAKLTLAQLLTAVCLTVVPVNASGSDSSWSSLRDEGNRFEVLRQFDDARKTYVSALEVARKFGGNSPQVAEINARLAATCLAEHKVRDAEFYTKAAMTIALAEKNGGEQNQDVLICMEDLAGAYLDEADTAVDKEFCFTKAIEIREKLFGTNHPNLSRTYANFARYYLEKNRYDKAVPLLEAAAKINSRTISSGKYTLAKTIYPLAESKYKEHKLDQSEKLCNLLLDLPAKTKDYRYTARAYEMLGKIYAARNKLDMAETFYSKAVKFAELHYAETSSHIKAIVDLARFYCSHGKRKQALVAFDRAIELARMNERKALPEYIKERESCKK